MQNRIRELRKQKGITMKQLGAALGLAESTISQYETGKREPDLRTLVKISEYFGVRVEDILPLELFDSGAEFDQALGESGTIADQEGAIAPVDAYIGELMRVVKDIDKEGRLDLLLLSEFFSKFDRENQKQMLRFAAFLASNPKFTNSNEVLESKTATEASSLLREKLLTLMHPIEDKPPQEE